MRHTLDLLRTFLVRDLSNRYRGSTLGLVWYVLNPIFMLGVFTTVFSGVFRMRWSGQGDSTLLFALNVFAGLLVNSFFSEAWQRGAQAILSQPALVKRVVFPLLLLPLVTSISSLTHCLLGLLILGGFAMVFVDASMHLGYALLALPPMLLLAIGVSWMLAALTVYLRDLTQVVALALTAMMFLSPVFYPLSQVPDGLRSWILLNPITIPAEALRASLLGGPVPALEWLGFYWLVAVLVLVCGALMFRFLSRGFADVL